MSGFLVLLLELFATLVLVSVSAFAQQPAAPAMPSPEIIREMQAAEARNNAMPDTPGTGRYPAIKEADASLKDHVIYRPANLRKLGKTRLGIVAWGNGGCNDDGANARQHLLEIASHGYLVIANGTIKSGPGVPPPPPMVLPAAGPNGVRILPPPKTSADMLSQAINWAIAENGRKGGAYYRKLDTAAIAVSGWSCGGLQALEIASSDPRVKTAVIHNSGVFITPMPGRGMSIQKSALDKLKAPLIYILGGPTDIAYANGMDDYARISTAPVAIANLDIGHGGTFYTPNGGRAAQVAVAWLNWQLRRDKKAGTWFTGLDCKLCKKSEWKFESKGF